METQTQEVRRVGSIDVIKIVQMLHDVKKRLERKGFRPVLPTDRPRLGQTYLRVEVQKYYQTATVNDDVGTGFGTRFVPIRKNHLTPEGLASLFRVEHDLRNPANNDIRWYTRIEGRR